MVLVFRQASNTSHQGLRGNAKSRSWHLLPFPFCWVGSKHPEKSNARAMRHEWGKNITVTFLRDSTFIGPIEVMAGSGRSYRDTGGHGVALQYLHPQEPE